MSDIQSASAPTLSTSATTLSTTVQLNAIQVAVDSLSQSLQDLTHTIQTNATPVAAPNGNSLTLATALGNITVVLPQLSEAVQQDLTQQLLNLVQTQRSLTLSILPGLPPTQAVLLIPTGAQIAANAGTVQNVSAQPVPAQNLSVPSQLPLNLPPVAKGDTLPALVLPSAPVVPQTVPLSTGQSYGPPSQFVIPSAVVSSLTSNPLPSPTPLPTITVQPAQTQVPTGALPVPAPNVAAQPATTTTPPVPVPVAPQNVAEEAIPALPALPTFPQNTASPSVAPPPTTPLATLLEPGNEVTLQVETVLPTGATPQTMPPLGPNQIIATVTGNTQDGKLIVQAGDATLFVKAPVAAPVGTNLVVTVEAAKSIPLIPLPTQQQQAFQSLVQAMEVLAQTNPQALQQMLAMNIPQPNEMLPSTLLLLFGAFKQGDVRGWLGNNAAESLFEAGKGNIIESLSRELSSSGQSVQDPIVGEWHSYPIPLYAQQQFQALNLYVHNDRNRQESRGGASSADKKIRFVIDMRLSKLGAMQLDGFVQTKKLDMILRSEALLPEGMHNDLRGAYINAMSAVGYTGSLNFQVGRHHWLNMQKTASRGIVT